jgi:type II secretory pathway component PulF
MKSSGYFPSYIVNMTQIGSLTGKLENVMNSLSLYYEVYIGIGQEIAVMGTVPLDCHSISFQIVYARNMVILITGHDNSFIVVIGLNDTIST